MRDLFFYLDAAEHAAGGSLDPRYDLIDVVNDAGRYLTRMHDWNWLERPRYEMQLVSGQQWGALPGDFAAIKSVDSTNNYLRSARVTTVSHLDHLRGNIAAFTLDFYVAIEYPAQNASTENQPGPRLHIYPTPGSGLTDAAAGTITMRYRAGWLAIKDEISVPNVPEDVEGLLIELVRAHGKAYAKGGTALHNDLEAIERSTMVQRLKEHYGRAQTNLGRLQGGIAKPPTPGRQTVWLHDTIDVRS